MARYIDADALGVGQCNPDIMQNKAHADGWNLLLDIINNAPTADVAPVVHGEWLNFIGDFSTAECSMCGEIYEVTPEEQPCEEYFNAFKQFYKFCTNCGADMRKAVE